MSKIKKYDPIEAKKRMIREVRRFFSSLSSVYDPIQTERGWRIALIAHLKHLNSKE